MIEKIIRDFTTSSWNEWMWFRVTQIIYTYQHKWNEMNEMNEWMNECGGGTTMYIMREIELVPTSGSYWVRGMTEYISTKYSCQFIANH